MSSHHFVREGQEPALVIIDGLSWDTAAPLLEWAPLVVVADQALAKVSLWGVKIDFVLTAQDSENLWIESIQEQQRSQLVPYTRGKLFETAISILISHKNTAANVMIEDPHEFMRLSEIQSFPVTFITSTQRWSIITKHHFEKWFPENTAFRVSPENTAFSQHSGVEIVNGIGRTLSEGLISLKSAQSFWIGEFL